ncbi:hypothetical protein IG631_00598 [Alternaria alternata]|nr:hypothetical protein IG631_00598 [Alternaria alternata]
MLAPCPRQTLSDSTSDATLRRRSAAMPWFLRPKTLERSAKWSTGRSGGPSRWSLNYTSGNVACVRDDDSSGQQGEHGGQFLSVAEICGNVQGRLDQSMTSDEALAKLVKPR